ncbi:MAG: hypothetical protein KBT84_15985, partial [Pseudomonas sp.]|nr:hypothetical protein [Pseudomonas sp.]
SYRMKCVFTRQQSLEQTLSGGCVGLGGICAVNNNDRLGILSKVAGIMPRELKITTLIYIYRNFSPAYGQ